LTRKGIYGILGLVVGYFDARTSLDRDIAIHCINTDGNGLLIGQVCTRILV